MAEEELHRWYCVRCKISVAVLPATLQVYDKKGHKMKRLSDKELALEIRAEGMVV